jgi:uncharacterized repeat protein (TIGR03943 family)
MKALSPSFAAWRRAALFGFLSGLLAWLLLSGKIDLIAHPRMRPWVALAAICFLALAAFQFIRPRAGQKSGERLSHFYPLIFAAAIVLIFTASGGFASAASIPSSPEEQSFASTLRKRDEAVERASQKPLPPEIVFDDDAAYWALYNRIYDEPAAAAGKSVVVQGFVYRGADFPPGSFLVSRNLMWCCSADMATIGFLVEASAKNLPPDNAWVEVRGRFRLDKQNIEGRGPQSMPCIGAESVREVPRAYSSTIFPY